MFIPWKFQQHWRWHKLIRSEPWMSFIAYVVSFYAENTNFFGILVNKSRVQQCSSQPVAKHQCLLKHKAKSVASFPSQRPSFPRSATKGHTFCHGASGHICRIYSIDKANRHNKICLVQLSILGSLGFSAAYLVQRRRVPV